jgi:hypothetical protein
MNKKTPKWLTSKADRNLKNRRAYLEREILEQLGADATQIQIRLVTKLLARDDLLPFILSRKSLKVKSKKRVVEKVCTRDFIYDLYFLEAHLKSIYGGWERAEERGLNWQTFFAQWGEYLTKQPKFITSKVAFHFCASFEKIQVDNHFCQGPWRYVPDIIFKKSRQVQKPKGYVIDKNIKVFNQRRITIDPILISSKKLSLNKIKLQMKAIDKNINQFAKSDEVVLKILSKKIAYFRVPTMDTIRNEQLANLKYPIEVATTDVLIVDIRNNGGWNFLGFWQALVELAGIQNEVDNYSFDLTFKENIHTRLMSFAFNLDLTIKDSKITSQNFFKKLNAQTIAPSKPMIRKNLFNKKFRISKKKIVLISNRFVGSDAEALLVMISTIKNSVIIGENTSGTCEFVQPGFLFLPNTNLKMMIPRGANNDIPKGQERIDGIGFSPDIYLSGTSWNKKSILALINGL